MLCFLFVVDDVVLPGWALGLSSFFDSSFPPLALLLLLRLEDFVIILHQPWDQGVTIVSVGQRVKLPRMGEKLQNRHDVTVQT